jgi:hypothetical protein
MRSRFLCASLRGLRAEAFLRFTDMPEKNLATGDSLR